LLDLEKGPRRESEERKREEGFDEVLVLVYTSPSGRTAREKTW